MDEPVRGNTVKIRMFEHDDVNDIVCLANTFASFDSDVDETFFQPAWSFPQGCLIAEDEGKIIGFIFSYLRDVPSPVLARWRATKVAAIELLAVDVSYRHQGVGTALLDKLLDTFRNEGVDHVLLHCPVEAVEAKHLYEKNGFEIRVYAMRKRL